MPSIEQIRCITKPVIRDGEIVRDPFIQIYRHEKYKKSDLTTLMRGEDKAEEFEVIRHKNDNIKEPLFDENVDFTD